VLVKFADLWKAQDYKNRNHLELPNCVADSAASHLTQTQMPKAWRSPLESEWYELYFPNAKLQSQDDGQGKLPVEQAFITLT